jgi:site-specific DNA recombinase
VLGYDIDPSSKRLIVNPEEAEQVKTIFALFEQHRSAILTLADIERRGWRLKSWTRKTGQFRPGGPFQRTSLRRLLTNVLYTGAIRHKGQLYPGEHPAIIEPGMWERVQELVAQDATFAQGKSRNKHQALLSGLLYCESCGTRMVYSYSGRNGRRYPYYVCLNAQRRGWAMCPGKSLPAACIEESVVGQLRIAQPAISNPLEWDQLERTQQVDTIRAMLERIGYNGATSQVSIRFRGTAITGAGEEAQA